MEFLNVVLAIDPNYLLLGMLMFFFSLELLLEKPRRWIFKGKHLLTNLLLAFTLFLLNLIFLAFQIRLIEELDSHQIGLLHALDLPIGLKLILGVVFYDFSTYWIHRASHKIPILWRLHRVHHSDTYLDSSTTFRFHPLELILIYQTGNIVTAGIFGTDVLSLSVYYLLLNIFFFLEHSRFNYPDWLNKTFGLLFVTPDFHRVHHHKNVKYTDSNYADIFVIWDRIFGTFRTCPKDQIQCGLEEFDHPKKQTFLYLLKSPFLKTHSE